MVFGKIHLVIGCKRWAWFSFLMAQASLSCSGSEPGTNSGMEKSMYGSRHLELYHESNWESSSCLIVMYTGMDKLVEESWNPDC